MHRLYCANVQVNHTHVELTDSNEIHHALRVLRLKVDDHVSFFDGNGVDGEAVIEKIADDQITLRITHHTDHRDRHQRKIVLACAMPKNAKFDDIVDKCTQCGVDDIIPMMTERTEVVLKGDRAQKKVDRFKAIALSAAKQSKRATLPRIHPITSFQAMFDIVPHDAVFLMPYLGGNERKTLRESLQTMPVDTTLVFLIGPEGDFTPEEIKMVQDRVIPIDLGPRVLRVDTAATTVVSFVSQFFHEQNLL